MKRHFTGQLTRKQFNQNNGISFTTVNDHIPSRVEMKTGLGVELDPTTKVWIPPFDPYEKELNDFNRIIGGGITNMREINDNLIHMKQRGDSFLISNTLTLNISNLSTLPFLTNLVAPSQKIYDIRLYNGFYLYLEDTSNKVKILQIGAVGIGETFSAEKITSWTNYTTPYETFTPNVNGHDIDSAINSVGNGFGYTNDGGFTTGKLYFLSTNLTINSGQAPHIFNGSLSGSAGTEFDKNPLTAGAYTKYATSIDSSHQYFWVGNDAAANYSLLCSWKQVTAPSSVSVWFAPVSEDSGWNPNSATYKATIKYKI